MAFKFSILNYYLTESDELRRGCSWVQFLLRKDAVLDAVALGLPRVPIKPESSWNRVRCSGCSDTDVIHLFLTTLFFDVTNNSPRMSTGRTGQRQGVS
jgi:hypothetical protein